MEEVTDEMTRYLMSDTDAVLLDMINASSVNNVENMDLGLAPVERHASGVRDNAEMQAPRQMFATSRRRGNMEMNEPEERFAPARMRDNIEGPAATERRGRTERPNT